MFFWNSSMGRWVSSKKSNYYFSSMAIGAISEKNSKQGGGWKTWHFWGVYWKNIMWKFLRSIKKELVLPGEIKKVSVFGLFLATQVPRGVAQFCGIFLGLGGFILSGISKDKVSNLRTLQFFSKKYVLAQNLPQPFSISPSPLPTWTFPEAHWQGLIANYRLATKNKYIIIAVI